jgi:HD-like signal output (HDOD) protein
MAITGDNNLNEELQRRLLQLQEIAPPSAMGREIIAVVTDERADLEPVVATIEKYPELTARILRCANSAYYGHRGNIYSVAEAIIRVLGLSVTKGLVLSLALESSFRNRNCPGFKIENYWFSAVLTANLARSLAPLMRTEQHPDLGAAYTAGLLHNLGLLALVELFPQQMSKVFAEPDTDAELALMQSLLGVNAQQAGAVLGRRWGLPEPLVYAIAHCRDSELPGADKPLLSLLRVAVVVADRLFLGAGVLDLPDELHIGLLDPSDVEAVVAQIAERIEDLRGMAQLLAGDRG